MKLRALYLAALAASAAACDASAMGNATMAMAMAMAMAMEENEARLPLGATRHWRLEDAPTLFSQSEATFAPIKIGT
ncbi:MAG: hypothetical protein ACREYA_11200 [Cupriavidus necator]